MTIVKFKKGDSTFMKCVGYGYTTYEECEEVVSVSKGQIKLENRDYPFDAATGKQICDLPDLGLKVTLCVTTEEIARAKKYIKDNA
jgi:hypothetical protein